MRSPGTGPGGDVEELARCVAVVGQACVPRLGAGRDVAVGAVHSGSCQTCVPPAHGRAGTPLRRPRAGREEPFGNYLRRPQILLPLPRPCAGGRERLATTNAHRRTSSAPPAPCRAGGTVWQLPPATANPSSPPPALCRRAGTFGNYQRPPQNFVRSAGPVPGGRNRLATTAPPRFSWLRSRLPDDHKHVKMSS